MALTSCASTEVVYADISKSFSSVNHICLIERLGSSGFDRASLAWLEDFLASRCQRVIAGACFSELGMVCSGVPQ